ncbi:putative ABC transporter ATP-binding protein [Pseudobythopirellula maris]|uniref:Putative ABC transporter ATP-binding protein n=1 Tax=Pseudobythopirellula maris TaxID=2527991 RepID=A0A5C5ZKI2_9BACT|nr:ABC transporter ATP-binding protein [Pseudobythopirellula maris]TWT86933.1 putative ABC transporter ATP-binding protein [Pseudobythopirellula maris]
MAGAQEKKPAEAGESLVEARGVTVRFGDQTVLEDVSLHVERGETLVIIGESGCGKTVLMKTLIGLIAPTEGRVVFGGKRLDKMGEKELSQLRTRVGYVFQNAALFDSLTVADNVAFPLVEHGRANRETAYQQAIERLSAVGLPPSVMAKRPAELSGGMRKRVGLARALIVEPELLLYDEPTTGLDPIMSDVINELITRTCESSRQQGAAVTSVIVTHDMRSVLKLADRIVMLYPHTRLEPGEPQVIFEGTPDEIEASDDPRVSQFVRGEAGERLDEMRAEANA